MFRKISTPFNNEAGCIHEISQSNEWRERRRFIQAERDSIDMSGLLLRLFNILFIHLVNELYVGFYTKYYVMNKTCVALTIRCGCLEWCYEREEASVYFDE